jgi:hypothetical protein
VFPGSYFPKVYFAGVYFTPVDEGEFESGPGASVLFVSSRYRKIFRR